MYSGYPQPIGRVMKSLSLAEWESWIKSIHVVEMDLGLSRVSKVYQRMGLSPQSALVVTVGGTNGKGSVVAGLESIYRAAGYRVGAFSSPVLFRLNEYVRVQGCDVSDETLCEALDAVDGARQEISLTSFEFMTLAAFYIFKKENLNLWLLEVGLGGRLDAVNVIDADVAVITSIDLDHQDVLGETREAIGFEKAGIFRPGQPVVCGDVSPPASVIEVANKVGSHLFVQGADFDYRQNGIYWGWARKAKQKQVRKNQDASPPGPVAAGIPAVLARKACPALVDGDALRAAWEPSRSYTRRRMLSGCLGDKPWFDLEKLPQTSLLLQNMSTALMVVSLLQEKLSVSYDAIVSGLKNIKLPGRLQTFFNNEILHIVDVSHNPAAISVLADYLRNNPCKGKTRAVFSMLADKDIVGSLREIQNEIDQWYIAPLSVSRAASRKSLEYCFKSVDITSFTSFSDLSLAYQQALEDSDENDRIIIFGSFHTVSTLMKDVHLTQSKLSFVEFIRQSPLVGVELDLRRNPSTCRDIDCS